MLFRSVAYGPLVVVGVCMGIGLPVAGLLSTRGRIDPERLTLQFEWARSRDGGLTIGMRNWTALRRVQFGPVAVCLASYAPGTAGGAPRLFVLPATVASDADAAFERALAASPETAAREGNPAVAATLAAFGVGTLAGGVALRRLVALPPGISLWFLAVSVTFGLLFLALAAYER